MGIHDGFCVDHRDCKWCRKNRDCKWRCFDDFIWWNTGFILENNSNSNFSWVNKTHGRVQRRHEFNSGNVYFFQFSATQSILFQACFWMIFAERHLRKYSREMPSEEFPWTRTLPGFGQIPSGISGWPAGPDLTSIEKGNILEALFGRRNRLSYIMR